MSKVQTKSEVAQLRARIALECEAMQQAMQAPASVASHRIIQRKYTAIGKHQQKLAQLVGEDRATQMMTEIYTEKLG